MAAENIVAGLLRSHSATDRPTMAPRQWSRAEIEEFVAGAVVYLRDAHADPVAPPPWLARAAGRIGRESVVDRITAMHPDDWHAYIGAFELVVANPSEVAEVDCRILTGDLWTQEHCRLANMLDRTDVTAIVYAIRPTGIVEPRDDASPMPMQGQLKKTPWFVARLDAGGKATAIDGDVEKILGVQADEVIGHFPAEWMHPDCLSNVLTGMLHVRQANGNMSHSRNCFVRADGSHVWADCAIVNHLDFYGGGDIMMVSLDITDHIRQEEATRASDEALRIAAEAIDDAFYRADTAGRLVVTNERWDQLFAAGGQADDLVGLFDPSARAEMAAMFAAADADLDGRSFPVEGLALDGRTRISLTCRAFGARDAAGSGYVGTAHRVGAEPGTGAATASGAAVNLDRSTGALSPGAATT